MTHVCLRLIPTVLVAVAALVMAFARPVGATPFPGPDAFGYQGVRIQHTLRNISNSGTFVALTDDQVSGDQPIGFTFKFYGINYTQFRISSNGFISLGTSETDNGCCTGEPIPDASSPNNIVAGWWEDLNLPQGNIRFQTLGAAPNRQLVVGFYNNPHFNNGPPVTFEIVLHEGNHAIELQCANCASDGGTHSIGIENATGTIGLEVFHGTSPQINQGWLLYACTQATIVGTPGNNAILGTNGPDVIDGLGGIDVIDGRGGCDLICGSAGNDVIEGNAGNDILDGGPGFDILNGGGGSDTCIRGEVENCEKFDLP